MENNHTLPSGKMEKNRKDIEKEEKIDVIRIVSSSSLPLLHRMSIDCILKGNNKKLEKWKELICFAI